MKVFKALSRIIDKKILPGCIATNGQAEATNGKVWLRIPYGLAQDVCGAFIPPKDEREAISIEEDITPFPTMEATLRNMGFDFVGNTPDKVVTIDVELLKILCLALSDLGEKRVTLSFRSENYPVEFTCSKSNGIISPIVKG